jgi:NAD(P)H-hydrate epimerase
MAAPSQALEFVRQLPVLPPRSADSNKGTFGGVLVVAGSRGMSGAAALCGQAALRGGAGLVRVATPQDAWPIVASANACYLTAPLLQDDHGQLAREAIPAIMEMVRANDVAALGPGLGGGSAIRELVDQAIAQTQAPLVLDADGLNALGKISARFPARGGAVVLTPHPGEFARLTGSDVPSVQANRQQLAVEFAARHGVVLVLKGYGTIVTDGRRVFQNATGNPGMATGGTGDVLTGLIAALLAQHLPAFEAAQLGVHVHGLAGDLARDELGEVSLIAADLLTYLPRALRCVRV